MIIVETTPNIKSKLAFFGGGEGVGSQCHPLYEMQECIE